MGEIIVGCGGWQYFIIPNMDPLEAYSMAFRFVEVNSTFYKIPQMDLVRSWRRRVPKDFEFSVRLNRLISHVERLNPTEKTVKAFRDCIKVAETLRSKILVLETPRSLDPIKAVNGLKNILKKVDLGDIRLAWEPRAGWLPKAIEEAIKLRLIPITDYSVEEPPYDDEEIAYTRLFGKGSHNIYQFTDHDLIRIKERAEKRRSKKIYLSFHGIRMYLDAARLERFLRKGELPRVTKSYGIDSLAEVLVDASFPATKEELVRRHGWKLIDIDEKTRVPASVILKQLRRKNYGSLEELLRELRMRFERIG
ncbi:hypothetical protein DRO64_10320 [Candidatus Bathyarchaeota archaeon]|nr:MAG: hypothetical protein DRO64_10320 [Candidatus Bathyarchaeota archaeon]